MIQTDFLTPPHSGSATSRAAAEAIAPSAATLRAQVLAYIRSQGEHGATRDEAERATGIAGSTLRPRALELIRMGLIEETTRTRLTAAGRNAAVLVERGA